MANSSIFVGPRRSVIERIQKIIFIGETSVGKTSLRRRFTDDTFKPEFMATVGFDYSTKTIQLEGETVRFQLWDTAGQERYRSITSAYFRGAEGFLLIYDVTNLASFKAVHFWSDQIKQFTWNECKVILVANKMDADISEHQVSVEDGISLADQLEFDFFQVSAKTGERVQMLFMHLVNTVYWLSFREEISGIAAARELPMTEEDEDREGQQSNNRIKKCC